jgi:hypothetical protein
VVAGTATAVSNRVSRRQAARWQRQSYDAGGYEDAGSAPEPAAPAPDPIAQLKELAALKQQGIVTEEEFAVQKAKLLHA